MVERSFYTRMRDGQWADREDPNAVDLFPPTSSGMRFRIFQLNDLLERRTRQARELLELWGTIQWGKRPGNPLVHLQYTTYRNRFPVSPNGEWAMRGSIAPGGR
ncbi:hypothetical protein FJTKL_04503 [Diaporthe vaccinii]|uniref:Uncharacterized protein n=1 Tax=Diaporthe vaccinii TaxID=105482 RepID=A0ABR4DSQ2_9PEZI